MKKDSGKRSKPAKSTRPYRRRSGRAQMPDPSLPVVPLEPADGLESNETDGGGVVESGRGRLTPAARLAILEAIAESPDAKPGERIKAIEMLDARDSGAGMRQSRSLFSIAREPILTADALQVTDTRMPDPS